MESVAIVGAGFAGSVIARELANHGYGVTVFDQRNHVAGNCHTERHSQTGVLVHRYGPHIFHTDNIQVWQYVSKFVEMMPYLHRVKAVTNNCVYSLPINLLTINQFYNKLMNPGDARSYISQIAESAISEPKSFEEQALSMIGNDLYESFFKFYTLKQWGIDPKLLPASILKRLPVRFNYDDNYFFHKYQGIPKVGYTELVARILDHQNIELVLGYKFKKNEDKQFKHVFYSGTIDGYFDYEYGRLGYRTLDFEEIVSEGDYLGCAVMNYCDDSVPYTRITEHKYFSPWEENKSTICFKEFSRDCQPSDIPYYPIRLVKEKMMLKNYVDNANKLEGITFIGRLGTYRYLDMDVVIKESLDVSKKFIEMDEAMQKPPSFFINPI